MAHLHYLTVQDLLWLNLELTEAVHAFHYASLEDAVYCQYGYGNSQRVAEQAARLAWEFPRKAPFKAGNAACAFAATVAFVELNGLKCTLADGSPAVTWAQALATGDRPDVAKFEGAFTACASDPHGSNPDDVRHLVRHALQSVMTRYAAALATLVANEAATPVALDVR